MKKGKSYTAGKNVISWAELRTGTDDNPIQLSLLNKKKVTIATITLSVLKHEGLIAGKEAIIVARSVRGNIGRGAKFIFESGPAGKVQALAQNLESFVGITGELAKVHIHHDIGGSP